MALSSLRPATSPRLFTIQLDFADCPSVNRPATTMIRNMDKDLRRIADEVARIEREFEGAVDFTVTSDSKFKLVFDTLNVRSRLVRRTRPRGRVDSYSFVLCRSFSATLDVDEM